MTNAVMVLCTLLGNASLAYGYSQAGMIGAARWCLLLGMIWMLAYWRKYYWFPALGFLLTLVAAAYGVWNHFTTIWMLLGALGGLLGWDLSDFALHLSYAAPTDDVRGMERRHLERVGIVAAIGVGIALLSVYIHINRLAFEVAVGLMILTVLVLARFVLGLSKDKN